ncbi:MAG: hypothetical protein M3Z96_06550 [Pseudomonadota bacterium]|nr:hypothetical protein [Pseudomonadota bacterium]
MVLPEAARLVPGGLRQWPCRGAARAGHELPARVAAIKGLLDRAYGKCVQPVSGEGGGPMMLQVFTGVRRQDA